MHPEWRGLTLSNSVKHGRAGKSKEVIDVGIREPDLRRNAYPSSNGWLLWEAPGVGAKQRKSNRRAAT